MGAQEVGESGWCGDCGDPPLRVRRQQCFCVDPSQRPSHKTHTRGHRKCGLTHALHHIPVQYTRLRLRARCLLLCLCCVTSRGRELLCRFLWLLVTRSVLRSWTKRFNFEDSLVFLSLFSSVFAPFFERGLLNLSDLCIYN